MEERETEQNQDEFMKEMCQQIQKSRKCQYCCECCLAYWIFIIMGGLFATKAADVECDWLGKTAQLFSLLCSFAVLLRIIDGILIIIPWSKSTLHCVTSFHKWNYNFEIKFCFIFLILLTLFWFLFEECEEFRKFVFWFLILAWLGILIWYCLNDDDKK